MQVDYNFENKLRFASEHGANATTETAFGYQPTPVGSAKKTSKYIKPIELHDSLFKTDFERWLYLHPVRDDRKNYDYLNMFTEEKAEEKDGNFFYEKYKEAMLLEAEEERKYKEWYLSMQAEAEANFMNIIDYVELTKQRYK